MWGFLPFCCELLASSLLKNPLPFSSIAEPLLALCRATAWAVLLLAEEWDVDNKMDLIVLLYISRCIIHQLGRQGSGEIFIDTRNVTRVLILHPLKIISEKTWLQNATREE